MTVSNAQISIRRARFPEDAEVVRALFTEYAEELGFSLCFQGFDDELAQLPGAYAEPSGTVLLLTESGNAVGCGAVRPLGDGKCEMKRLFVKPEFRGAGRGRRLATALLEFARAANYTSMVLDTLKTMTAAIDLYRSLGFRETEPYYDNPMPEATYLELKLEPS